MCISLICFFCKFSVMHDLRMIHTDLKPENILLVSSDYVKVPDYKVYIILHSRHSFFELLLLPLNYSN
jgi:serine/threonine protein kinase